jgi:transposase
MRLKRWQEQEQVRQKGTGLLRAGVSPTDIALRLEVSRMTVYNWQARGAGLRARIRPCGRKAKLTIDQRARLERILEHGAVAYGFSTEVWTGERIARVVREQFGVSYHPKFIPWLLRSWGWSWQKPVRQARERDEATVRRWVQKRWPQVKKTPSAGVRA